MADRSTVLLDRLRDIGWAEWDPIGLADAGSPRDEYDRYLLQVVGRFWRGETVDQAADYLDHIGVEHMGLGPSTPASREAAARTAVLIKGYLDTLAPGPLKVR
jgi:hypothetical protein